jgi:transposase
MTSIGVEKMTNNTIGVDISKDSLDAYSLADAENRQFTNDKSGRRALIKWLGKSGCERVVFEPTGPYHKALERTLASNGLAFVKVNPRQARRFAEATGSLAKTDRADAALLARMGAVLQLEPTPAQSDVMMELKELNAARQALIKDRTAAQNRAKNIGSAMLGKQNKRRRQQIERDIEQIESVIVKLIQADAHLARRLDILLSIKGIATITATILVIEMPELGTLDAKQVASLAGLAPITRQSGTWRGKAFIQGGRAQLRNALYMPALVAARFNTDMKAAYSRLTQAGKPAKVAINAVRRKLIVLANALLRDNRMWQEKAA